MVTVLITGCLWSPGNLRRRVLRRTVGAEDGRPRPVAFATVTGVDRCPGVSSPAPALGAGSLPPQRTRTSGKPPSSQQASSYGGPPPSRRYGCPYPALRRAAAYERRKASTAKTLRWLSLVAGTPS